MNVRAQINFWLSLNQSTYEKLAVELSKVMKKKYTRGSINGKLVRGTLSINEFEAIAKLLGYKIEFVEINKKGWNFQP